MTASGRSIGTVEDAPGQYGRVTPFGANSTTTSTYLRGHVGTGTAAGLLRISRADVTNWIGAGSSLSNTQAKTSVANTSISATNEASRAPSRRTPAMPATYDNAAVTKPKARMATHHGTWPIA